MGKSVKVSEEKKYKALFENTLTALFITKPDGTIVEANPAAEEMFGYTVSEFRKIGRLGVLDPDSPGLQEKLKEREEKGYAKGELIGIKKGGERFLCEFASSIFEDDHGERYTSTLMIDISDQKKFEQILIQKEKQHIITLNSIRDLIFSLSVDGENDYKIIYANEPFAEVVGLSLEQVIGSGLDQILPADSKLRDRSLYKKAIQVKESISWEETVTARTGIKTGVVTVTPIFDQFGKCYRIICSITEITDRVAAEEELKRVMNQSLDVICTIDKDGKFIKVSDASKRIWGYKPEEIEGKPFIDLVHPDDRERTLKAGEDIMNGLDVTHFENRYVRKDGSIVDITWSIRWDKQDRLLYCVARDATDVRKSRKLIEESNERFEYVTQATSEAIWDYHPETNRMFWGEGFQTLFGYERVKVPLKYEDWREKVHPEDIDLVEKRIDMMINIDSKKWQQEYRFKNADGSYSFVVDKGILIRNSKGQVERMIGAIEDVTSRKIQDLQKSLAAEIHYSFIRSETISEALQASLESIMRLDYFLMTEIWMVNNDKDKILLTNKVSGNNELKKFYEETSEINAFLPDEGLPGLTWKSERDHYWEDFSDQTGFKRKEAARKAGIRKIISFPVMDDGIVTGVLVLGLKNEVKNERIFKPIFRELSVTLGSEISRKKLEDELTMIFESAPDIICIAGLDGYFKKVNPAMSELLGFTEKELLTTPIVEFTHPEDREKTENEFKNLREEKGHPSFENRYITKAGKVVWLSWTTKPLYKQGITFSVARNVTQQRELEELFRQANRMSKTGSWEVDLIDQEVYWSDVTKEIHEVGPGYQPEIEKAINFYKEGDNRDQLIQVFENAVEKGIPYDMELQIVTQKGNIKWVRTIGQPEIVEGKCIRVYGSFQDIHEDKELRRDLEKQAKELAASNAELEQFAFVASHDLQEPLRMITSFLAQLEKKYGGLLDDRGKKYIYFATDGARRMRQIILDLLDYSRVGRVNTDRSDVDINEILENVLTLQNKKIKEKRAEILWSQMPVVRAAKTPIQQLFQNLISNALNYQKPNQKPVIRIRFLEDEHYWKFSVEDNGIGIHSDYSEKIFNLFQRLHSKEEFSGTGLGLAISKKIVEEHGGEIWVESDEGIGSTFHFTIKK